jgi:hypothetical protein
MTMMRKALLLAAALGLSTSTAFACEFQRSAKVDATVVASVTPAASAAPQSTPATKPVVLKEQPSQEEEAE